MDEMSITVNDDELELKLKGDILSEIRTLKDMVEHASGFDIELIDTVHAILTIGVKELQRRWC